MHSFDNATAIAEAPTNTSLDTALRTLLADRVHDWMATGLLDLTHVLIIEPGDTEADIVEAVGFSPLVNHLNGRRFGQAGFVPPFDWLELEDGWFELIQTVGNDGFSFHVFIPNAEGVDSELLALCHRHAQ